MIDSYILALVDYALDKNLIEQDDYIYTVKLCFFMQGYKFD